MDEEGGEGIKRSEECVVLVMIEMISAGEVNQLIEDNKTLPKAQRTQGVECISQVQTQILIKFQNFDQASTSKSQPNTSLSIKL